MLRKGVSSAEAFAGYCNDCGREMRKPKMGEAGKEHGWMLTPAKGLCVHCYRKSNGYRRTMGGRISLKAARRLSCRAKAAAGIYPCGQCGGDVDTDCPDVAGFRVWCDDCFEELREGGRL